jgi:hypothetical protein
MRGLNIVHVRIPRKDGKPGKRFAPIFYHYSVIDRCDHCGRVSSADWVKRWHYRLWRKDHAEPDPTLCLGCFNRIRPLWRAEIEAWEMEALVRKLKREILRAKREPPDNGRPQDVPLRHDGEGPRRQD